VLEVLAQPSRICAGGLALKRVSTPESGLGHVPSNAAKVSLTSENTSKSNGGTEMFESRMYVNNTATQRGDVAFPPAVNGATIPSPAGYSGEDVTVGGLVEGARRGDQAAWNALVARYLPLVRSVTRTYRLSEKDAEDVSQTVWLRLVGHLAYIREPMALPGWISTVARHESLLSARIQGRTVPIDPLGDSRHDLQADGPGVEADLLRAERHQALRDGLAELPASQRELLLLLAADPPLSYRDISQRLGIPVGSIGPTRARCLKRLRETPTLRPFLQSSALAEAGPARA
jgi:RNA polymerase sigma factor (sigma-70 family)